MTLISSIGIRRITIDPLGRIYTIVSMFDRGGSPTQDPTLAATCVVLFNGEHIPQDVDDVPIYTVH